MKKTCAYNRTHSESNLSVCPECSRDYYKKLFDDTCSELEKTRMTLDSILSNYVMLPKEIPDTQFWFESLVHFVGEGGTFSEAKENYKRLVAAIEGLS